MFSPESKQKLGQMDLFCQPKQQKISLFTVKAIDDKFPIKGQSFQRKISLTIKGSDKNDLLDHAFPTNSTGLQVLHTQI